MNEEELKLLDKIKELPKELNIEIRGLILAEIVLREENKKLKEQLQQKEDIINKAKEFIKKHNERAGKLYYKYDNKYLLSEIKEDLSKILDNKGE